MKFKMSTNVAVRTKDFSKAVDFYKNVIGFNVRSETHEEADIDANPLTLFVIKNNEIPGPVMELFVDDLEKAKEILVENGCKILRWRGKGQDCYIEDPFGVKFNIWEE
ncbi:MAG: VOC family protein [Ignavibacteria bacterium]|nr:VOC family protein [Ignavibacteria bacterium]